MGWPPHAFPAPGHLCEPPSTNADSSHTRTLPGSLQVTISRFTLAAISDPVAAEHRGEDLDPDLSGSKTVLSAVFLPASEQFLLQKHKTKQNKNTRWGRR